MLAGIKEEAEKKKEAGAAESGRQTWRRAAAASKSHHGDSNSGGGGWRSGTDTKETPLPKKNKKLPPALEGQAAAAGSRGLQIGHLDR